MAWFKVDDALHAHMKAMRAGAAAMGLWVLAGSWASDQLTDGWVPEYAIHRWSPDAMTLAEQLVAAGFWVAGERDNEQGWWFHEWEEHQPTREEVLARRKSDAARRAAWRDEQKRRRGALESHRDTDKSHRDDHLSHRDASQCDSQCDNATLVLDDEMQDAEDQLFSTSAAKRSRCDDGCDTEKMSHGDSACPDPTRPDPGSSKEEPRRTGSRKRSAHPLPANWEPNANHELFAQENDLDLAHEADQFRNHAEANDRRQVGWDAAFRQWIGNAAKWQRSRRAQVSSNGHRPFQGFTDDDYADGTIPTRGAS